MIAEGVTRERETMHTTTLPVTQRLAGEEAGILSLTQLSLRWVHLSDINIDSRGL